MERLKKSKVADFVNERQERYESSLISSFRKVNTAKTNSRLFFSPSPRTQTSLWLAGRTPGVYKTLLTSNPDSYQHRVAEMALLEITTLALVICVTCLVFLFVWKKSHKAGRLPPGPTPLPIIGNLMQLNLKDVPASLSKVRGFHQSLVISR